ncbi:MAG: poly-gamma-glutamate hydrolase family protein [Methylotenera sp.]|nr:poly-gamma-glutamate hydrolase family protein [Oligoflexia bacterium]
MVTLIELLLATLPFWVESTGLASPRKPDTYRDFAALAAHEKEGVDFSVQIQRRTSPFTVFAIHGGKIEPFTSEIAKSCATDNLNLYLFEGIKPQGNGMLHLTSERFDEPRARKLARESSQCVSIHGFAEQDHEIACAGGGNSELQARFIQLAERAHLKSPGIEIRFCPKLPGTSADNIVNRCRQPGLQLELSAALRVHLKKDPELLRAFSRVVRLTLAGP